MVSVAPEISKLTPEGNPETFALCALSKRNTMGLIALPSQTA